MLILHKAMHIIDYENLMATAVPRLPDEFNLYLGDLMDSVNQNNSVKKYKPRSQNTQVVSCVRAILSASVGSGEPERPELCAELFQEIAKRLLEVEARTQDRINRLDQQIKKGSLVQSLLFNEESEEYLFMLAKVEHAGFFDDIELRPRTGIARNKKKIWKTCVFECNLDEDRIGEARIFLDSQAVYWGDGFLELDEMLSDEANTQSAFKWIDHTLKRVVRDKAPSDYVIIRNAVIGYLRTHELIDYAQMVADILEGYVPVELPTADLIGLAPKLNELPEKKEFDSQFRAIPGSIGARVITKYPVNDGIELRISGHVADIENTIRSEEEDGGEHFIKIRTNNNQTYEAFRRRIERAE